MADPDPSTRPSARDPELGFPPPGEVLHRLRTQRGMSLRQVAAECGLSVSFLASLERGETDIALERLGRLAKVFDHDVGSFLGFSRGRATPSVFPREEQETLNRAPGVVYRVLRSPELGYQVVTGDFQPGCGLTEDLQHEGTDLVMITGGTLVARYNGVDHELRAGDCIQWSAGHPHTFRNDGEEPAQMVVVLFSSLY
ncbi:XRE family transcriptional regulator [Streptomyces aurantiacus]|uniref:Putative HTH-type transcriptional regulator PuuR n=1 Tax=Streptomyces aurantiacus JA 4570 TaxID=1286094 RepID=S3Z754_9ACTN|nr:XRE family transcriptional regulator [Streptomyces aurantiacus]EPH39546.1 putative HTH-type transcriptional regulator PuuR [Streptomyces aurantiacus JA 4570]